MTAKKKVCKWNLENGGDSFLKIVSNLVCQMFAAARGTMSKTREKLNKQAGTGGNKTGENICINCRNDLTGTPFQGEQSRKARKEKCTVRFRRLPDEERGRLCRGVTSNS